MISPFPVAGASQGDYYVGLTAEDYYLKGGEPLGEWYGKGAAKLGLEGRVQSKDLTNLLLGFSKDGTLPLVKNAGSETRQSGLDLSVAPSKSVSVFWAMAPPEIQRKIQDAQKEAIHEMLAYVEENLLFTRTGARGRRREKVLLVAALFEHGTSRAQDPHLHTHALILSCCPRANGKTGAIVSKILYDNKRELDRIYCEKFAKFFERDLRVSVKRTNGNFELPDVPLHVCSHFSKRRKQVLEKTASMGRYSPQAARIAALVTRPKKVVISRNELFSVCRKEGRELGFGPERVLEILARSQKLEDSNPNSSTLFAAEIVGRAQPTKSPSLQTVPQIPSFSLDHDSPLPPIKKQAGEKPSTPAETSKKQAPLFSELPSAVRPAAPIGISKKIAEGNPHRVELTTENRLAGIPSAEQLSSKSDVYHSPSMPGEKQRPPIPGRSEPLAKSSSEGFQVKPSNRHSPTPLKDAATPFEAFVVRLRRLVTILPRRTTPLRKLHVFGQALFRIPFTNLEVRTVPKPLFPRAPSWNPASRLPRLALVRQGLPLGYRPKLLSSPIRYIRLAHLALEVRRKLIAPKAPQFSPLFGKRVPVLQLTVRPSLRELRELRQRLAKENGRMSEKRRPRKLELSR